LWSRGSGPLWAAPCGCVLGQLRWATQRGRRNRPPAEFDSWGFATDQTDRTEYSYEIAVSGEHTRHTQAAFEVHARGCPDILRGLHRGRYDHAYPATGIDCDAAIRDELAEFEDLAMDWTEDGFRVMPCAAKAPIAFAVHRLVRPLDR
jgi:hypothetical protein